VAVVVVHEEAAGRRGGHRDAGGGEELPGGLVGPDDRRVHHDVELAGEPERGQVGVEPGGGVGGQADRDPRRAQLPDELQRLRDDPPAVGLPLVDRGPGRPTPTPVVASSATIVSSHSSWVCSPAIAGRSRPQAKATR
jgi:hypothetical protein